MKRFTIALAALALLISAQPAWGGTDQQNLEKALKKLVTDPQNSVKPKKGLCVCFDAGDFEHKVGFLVRRDAAPYVELACVVPGYDPEGALSGGGDCEDWSVIAK
jgi:hypothetical protein